MQVRKLLTENAVLPLWPDVGRDILGLSRAATYARADDQDDQDDPDRQVEESADLMATPDARYR